jgi:hypothetical protein
MQKKSDLIRENEELKARLRVAEVWMKREVLTSLVQIQRKENNQEARKKFANIFEDEGLLLIRQQILDQIPESLLKKAPAFTLDRLIDAEIYWYTLQKYPHMDAFPIVASYQKILDAWVEDTLISPWRNTHTCMSILEDGSSQIETDIKNILLKNYTLSLGRLYQILKMISLSSQMDDYVRSLRNFWQKNPEMYQFLISPDFLGLFSELIQREIFSTKRHQKKVSYRDVQITREILF